MDGNRFFLQNKCGRRVDDGVDWISELPDEIIVVILSFLSLREAASTSVLSSRWLDLWKYTPNLDFSKYFLKFDFDTRTQISRPWDVEKSKYIAWVNSVLQSHKAPSLKRFSTFFYVNKSAHLKVAKWLEFVFLKRVEGLNLDFQCEDPNYQVVLEELLLLRGSGLRQTDHVIIFFQSLKSLSLQCLKVSGEAIKMLLCNCPLLEELIIGYATLTSDVEVCGATLMLKFLRIYSCTGNKSIKVSAPNLISLMVDDKSGKLLLKNVPKLVEANFMFKKRVQHFASTLFRFSSQLKTLCLSLLRPEIFLANGFFPQMPNLNKLVVHYSGVKTRSLLPVTALIWASPRLEEFKLLFTETIRVASVQVVRDAERSPHRHLKLFELEGFMDGAVHHVELANYILDNCAALQKIIIRPTRLTLPLSAAIYFENILDEMMMNQFVDKIQAAIDYAKQQLEGKIPQHIQLAIFSFNYHC